MVDLRGPDHAWCRGRRRARTERLWGSRPARHGPRV